MSSATPHTVHDFSRAAEFSVVLVADILIVRGGWLLDSEVALAPGSVRR